MTSTVPTIARFLFALSLSLLAAVPAAAQPCPASTIWFIPPGPDPETTTDAVRSLSHGWDLGRGNAAYDLHAGTVRATSIGDPSGGFGAHVRAGDRYVLLGPAGPPVHFSVRLYVSGTAEGRNDGYLPTDMGSVTVSAALLEMGGGQDSATVTADPGLLLGFTPTLEVSLDHAAGEPFELVMALHSQGGFSTGMLDGKLSFIMPPGYAIASCQGFTGSGATAVTGTSWGSLKLRFR